MVTDYGEQQDLTLMSNLKHNVLEPALLNGLFERPKAAPVRTGVQGQVWVLPMNVALPQRDFSCPVAAPQWADRLDSGCKQVTVHRAHYPV